MGRGHYAGARAASVKPIVPEPQEQSEPASAGVNNALLEECVTAGKARREIPTPPRPERGKPSRANSFINPYNFVPFGNPVERGEAKGHDTHAQDTYSGVIPITIKTVTPLLLVDQSKSSQEVSGHTTSPLRVDPHSGQPLLASSSVRGMLRSAFEAVTSSRMGVFDGTDRLAMRESPHDALVKLPAIVCEEDGKTRIRYVKSLCPKFKPDNANCWPPQEYGQGKKKKKEQIQPGILVPNVLVPEEVDGAIRSTAKERTVYYAWIRLMKHPRKHYYVWRVCQLAQCENGLAQEPPDAPGKAAYVDCGYTSKVRGVLLLTNSRFGSTKKDERMVFVECLDDRIIAEVGSQDVDETVKSLWEAALNAYREAAKEGDVPTGQAHRAATARRKQTNGRPGI